MTSDPFHLGASRVSERPWRDLRETDLDGDGGICAPGGLTFVGGGHDEVVGRVNLDVSQGRTLH